MKKFENSFINCSLPYIVTILFLVKEYRQWYNYMRRNAVKMHSLWEVISIG